MVTFLIVLSVYSLFLTLRFKNFTLKNTEKGRVGRFDFLKPF